METALAAAAIGLFVWAAMRDAASRIIPNRIVAALAALGLMRLGLALAGGAGWAAAVDLGVAAGVLVAGAVLHGARLLGGGDVKLLAAGALWLGAAATPQFLIWTALAGGVLALAHLAIRRLRAGQGDPRLPYGIAIAAAGVLGSVAAV